MTKINKIIALLVLLLCGLNTTASNYKILSDELTIEDDLRDYEYPDYYHWRDWRYFHNNTMTGVKQGRTGANFMFTGDFRITFSTRPVSLAVTTYKDGSLFDTPEVHEFGESPDYDANTPIGDAIIPMLLLMGLYVGLRRIKR